MRDMVWNVFAEHYNGRSIEVVNVFDHYSFRKDVETAYKKYKDDFDQFSERVRKDLMYYFWSKCEWETVWVYKKDLVVINTLFSRPVDCIIGHINDQAGREVIQKLVGSEDEQVKLDVYDQVKLCWDEFIHYTWNQCKARKSSKVRESDNSMKDNGLMKALSYQNLSDKELQPGDLTELGKMLGLSEEEMNEIREKHKNDQPER